MVPEVQHVRENVHREWGGINIMFVVIHSRSCVRDELVLRICTSAVAAGVR